MVAVGRRQVAKLIELVLVDFNYLAVIILIYKTEELLGRFLV